MDAYEKGFMEKCAEYGVDPEMVKQAFLGRLARLTARGIGKIPGIGTALRAAEKGIMSGGRKMIQKHLQGGGGLGKYMPKKWVNSVAASMRNQPLASGMARKNPLRSLTRVRASEAAKSVATRAK